MLDDIHGENHGIHGKNHGIMVQFQLICRLLYICLHPNIVKHMSNPSVLDPHPLA